MNREVQGSFEVSLTPEPADSRDLGAAIGRMSLDKLFSGPLAARSQGQMLAFRSPSEGSAGYVAMELVSGTLEGRSGTFVLQHSGRRERGTMSLDLQVVADSGTGELTGLRGHMSIEITGGAHAYRFNYQLPHPA